MFIARAILALSLVIAAWVSPARATDDAPRRVVSMNVCTDQLAMLLAGEGQLHSVSRLAGDPAVSVLADEAGRYVANHGLGEEIFLMRPDLIVAGTFTTRATIDMLRRLGFRVEEFAPAGTFEGVRANIRRMGELLGRQQRADELIAELDAGLAELAREPAPPLSVAIYSANSYTSGEGSLSNAVIGAAGLQSIADRLGIVGVRRLPLEQLVLADPDLVVLGERPYDRPALAQENFRHPAFRAIASKDRLVHIPDRYWICGAPFTLEAARLLRDAAKARAEAAQ